MDVFVGSIMTFGFNFPPYNWQLCNGQTLNLTQYQALFALIGTYYGGNGTTNFQLPNLQGRMPIGFGAGAGLTVRTIGESAGAENANILISNLPSHTHLATFTPSGGSSTTFKASSAVPPASPAYSTVPTTSNNVLAASPATGAFAAQIWAPSSTVPDITVAGVSGGGGGGTVTNASTGNNVPLAIMNPFLALNFSIAMQGIFPSRN